MKRRTLLQAAAGSSRHPRRTHVAARPSRSKELRLDYALLLAVQPRDPQFGWLEEDFGKDGTVREVGAQRRQQPARSST